MKMKGLIFALAALLLALPGINAQNVDAMTGADISAIVGTATADPIGMLGDLIDLVVERGPVAISQIANLCINIVMVFVAFLQLIVQLLLEPTGFPLLINLLFAGVMDAFSFGLTGLIYGNIAGLVVCSPCFGLSGALLGAFLGFFYGALNGVNAKLPPEIQNPYLESWKELVP